MTKLKDFKQGDIYRINDLYISEVIHLDSTTITFKDIIGTDGEWMLFETSLKPYKFDKLNIKKNPEYFL
jgi:hypothetical protein